MGYFQTDDSFAIFDYIIYYLNSSLTNSVISSVYLQVTKIFYTYSMLVKVGRAKFVSHLQVNISIMDRDIIYRYSIDLLAETSRRTLERVHLRTYFTSKSTWQFSFSCSRKSVVSAQVAWNPLPTSHHLQQHLSPNCFINTGITVEKFSSERRPVCGPSVKWNDCLENTLGPDEMNPQMSRWYGMVCDGMRWDGVGWGPSQAGDYIIIFQVRQTRIKTNNKIDTNST